LTIDNLAIRPVCCNGFVGCRAGFESFDGSRDATAVGSRPAQETFGFVSAPIPQLAPAEPPQPTIPVA
jgi:hypothetical protein